MKIIDAHVDVDKFFRKIKNGKSLLMLDYDGTLAPFTRNRMEAFPYPGIRERLGDLLGLNRTRVIIVSGRSLSEVESLLNIPSKLELWGSHGLERRLQSDEKIMEEVDATLQAGLELGKAACRKYIGTERCEIKPFAVALHWRGIESQGEVDNIKSIEPAWESICKDFELEIHRFDGGVELRPKGRNKGDVIRQLLDEVVEGTAIGYLGDDITDEEAFSELGDKGLKVLVRKEFRPTLADIMISPPHELLVFLDRWIINCK